MVNYRYWLPFSRNHQAYGAEGISRSDAVDKCCGADPALTLTLRARAEGGREDAAARGGATCLFSLGGRGGGGVPVAPCEQSTTGTEGTALVDTI